MAAAFAPSPPGIRVPHGGSCCGKCVFIADDETTCLNENYVKLSYRGKKKGDARFIDGETGEVVEDKMEFCCNVFDWER